ncbi:mitochondrial 2-oxoglutarate/malate carrier protein-like [Athalia rosae]|uniref:mitochondrial 2-oxoglutarate/malate carrier protein-like n=1 Tax=Athalia rosae TaxID=37344 RepID=UPI0020349522|nr:mitochondrial 2-oxoglutarate/malate carrier protein-like [Athalia rosae]
MDVVKIRMQVYKTGLVDTTKNTIKEQGPLGLYTGLSAALLRQITYTTARIGFFNTLSDICEKHLGRLNYPTLVSLGMIAGMIGALIGTPADVVMVRMIADVHLPPEKRRGYKHAVNGLIRIAKEEGVLRLWTGSIPTTGRAAIANGAQLGTYSRSKMFLKDSGLLEEGLLLQFIASLMSGIVAATASLPIDIAKTRAQNWKESGKPPSVGRMLLMISKGEGPRALWRGFLPYYARIAPNTVITMVCMDQLTRLYLTHIRR